MGLSSGVLERHSLGRDSKGRTEAEGGENKGKKSSKNFVLHSLKMNPGFMGSRIPLLYNK